MDSTLRRSAHAAAWRGRLAASRYYVGTVMVVAPAQRVHQARHPIPPRAGKRPGWPPTPKL